MILIFAWLFLHSFIQHATCASAIAHNQESCKCPEPWIQADWAGLGCLLFNSSVKYTWEQADVYCQEEQNSRLVEIKTEEQLEVLQTMLKVFRGQVGTWFWW